MNTITIARRFHKILMGWLPSLLLLFFLLVARSTLADHYYVQTGSMEWALIPGDHVLVNKAAYGLRIPFTKQVIALRNEPSRGEIVVFDSPDSDVRLIKRVVAVGGDHVVLRNGRLEINGEALALLSDPATEWFGERSAPLNLGAGGGPDIHGMIIPDGQVLVLGDHRGSSHDGRYFGTIPVNELYGRASGVFWRKKNGPTWQTL